MTGAVLDDLSENGGFPEPPSSAPVRVVTTGHECGARTIVRLPTVLPATVVRRVRCAGCQRPYESDAVMEIGARTPPAPAEAPAKRFWRRLRSPFATARAKRAGRWLSLPVGAAAVIGALVLIQGGAAEAPDRPASEGAAASDRPASKAAASGARSDARLVRGSRFALALPARWRRTEKPGGASFAAVAPGRGADATLWIEHAPELGLAAFEARSLEQLRTLADNARVAERVSAPTAEGTIIRLAAETPEGVPQVEVTLRAAGPYRYYLATTLKPNASRAAVDGVELIHGSFIPEAEGAQ